MKMFLPRRRVGAHVAAKPHCIAGFAAQFRKGDSG
jgi:hypothetical protein